MKPTTGTTVIALVFLAAFSTYSFLSGRGHAPADGQTSEVSQATSSEYGSGVKTNWLKQSASALESLGDKKDANNKNVPPLSGDGIDEESAKIDAGLDLLENPAQ